MRVLITVLIAAVGCFLLYNAVWFGWRYVKYGSYTDGMEQTVFSTFFTPRYACIDADGFDYSVKYPDWLSWTGNLAVGSPGQDDNPFTDGMILWPKLTGGFEYGLILIEDTVMYQIYADAAGHALDAEEEEIVQRHAETVVALYDKAGAQFPVK